MGITSISIDATPAQAQAEPVDAKEEAVHIQIGGGDMSVRWVFTDNALNTVDTTALVVLATPSDAASSTVANQEVHIRKDKLFVQLGEKHGDGRTWWILDTGVTNHMTGERSVFSNLDKEVHSTIRFRDGSVIDIEGRGMILFSCKNGEHQKLVGVYLIPKLTANIISLGQLDKDWYKILIEEGLLRIWDPRQCVLARVQRAENRLYTLDLNISTPVCLTAHGDDITWKWHTRYGHLGFHGLKLLSKKEMVRGLPAIDHVEQLCESCLTGKQRRHPFSAVSKFRATRSLELVHADLCGLITPLTPGGKRLFLLIVDDKSRYMWLVLLASKDQAAVAMAQLLARLEVEVGEKLGMLRTDYGDEFTAQAFANHCADHGVQRHFTTLYTPQQNGVVERRNQTVLGMARSMMKGMNVPSWLWGEAVSTAVFILNRSLTRSVEGRTPYEV
jgi:hypothetical protein